MNLRTAATKTPGSDAPPVADDEPGSRPPQAGARTPAGTAGHRGVPAPGARSAPRKRPVAGIDAAALAMSEKDLTREMLRILKDLRKLGHPINRYHPWNSEHSESGYPDETLVGPSRVMFRELKKQRGIVTKAQQEWLDGLTRAGQDAGVWRPSDFYSGRMSRELTALAGIGGTS